MIDKSFLPCECDESSHKFTCPNHPLLQAGQNSRRPVQVSQDRIGYRALRERNEDLKASIAKAEQKAARLLLLLRKAHPFTIDVGLDPDVWIEINEELEKHHE